MKQQKTNNQPTNDIVLTDSIALEMARIWLKKIIDRQKPNSTDSKEKGKNLERETRHTEEEIRREAAEDE